MSILVDTLIAQVREQTDENNTDDVKDAQIIRALNRAQRQATNILARRFEDMMWETTTVTTVGGTSEYDIPAAAFAGRIEKIEVETSSNVRYQVKKISNHRTTNFITSSQTQIPTQYSTKRNKFVLYPTPQDGLTLYVHYNKRAEDFVVQQGRIQSIDTDNNYIIVDDIGSGVTTSTTGFGAYLNIIDYNTGDIKNTLQVSALDHTTNQITFKTTGLSASTVLGHTIVTAIGTDAAVDDYVCLVAGTCVPEVDEAYTDYVLQHAIVAIRRRLGEPVVEDVAELKELKDELLVAWSGREQSHKVRRSSGTWNDNVNFYRHRRSRT